MKKKIIAIMVCLSAIVFSLSGPLNTSAKTSAIILNGCAEMDNGIPCVLGIVVDVMSIVVVSAAVIGIILSGINYITSSGDSGKMGAAKKRIFEIVVGLAIYALIWAGLKFLLPTFNGSTDVARGLFELIA